MKRTMCLWLPNWPIQRVRIETQNRGPLVLFATRGEAGRLLQTDGMRGTFTVTACSRLPTKNGVRPGMPLGEAESLLAGAGARFVKHDAAADRIALRKLARECHQYTPIVALEEAASPECLLLDITGSAHLFGGERSLAAKVFEHLSGLGYAVRLGIADGIGAAWAAAQQPGCFGAAGLLFAPSPPGTPGPEGRGEGGQNPSRYLGPFAGANPLTPAPSPPEYRGRGEKAAGLLKPAIIPPGQNRDVIPQLPVESLRLPPPIIRLLHQFDLRVIRQLMNLPRADLLVRFGEDLLTRLDQALGNTPEIFIPEPHTEPVRAAWQFEDPVTHPAVIENVLDRLFRQIVATAAPRQVGIHRLFCTLLTADKGHTNFSLGLLHPTLSLDRLRELLRLRLETVRLPAGVVEIKLRAKVGPLETRQPQWFESDETPQRAAAFRDLLERLSNRLGDDAVVRPVLKEDDQPEFAWDCVPWLGGHAQAARLLQSSRAAETGNRPHRQIHSPRPRYSGGEGSGVRGRSLADGSRLRGASCPPSPQPSPPGVPGGEGAVLVYPVELLPTPLAIHVATVDDHPCRLAWRQRSYAITQAWGPQRIDTGWWRDHDIHRDYYRVETDAGERFWLFRDRIRGTWFLHGIYA